MKNSSRLPLKGLVLLSLPVLGIVAYAFLKPKPEQPVATLVIKETRLRAIPTTMIRKGKPSISQLWTKMDVSFSYAGEKPEWWGKRQNENLNFDTRVNFKTTNPYFNDSDTYSSVDYDNATGHYFFTFTTHLPDKREFLDNANYNISVVAMTQEQPTKQLGKVYFSKPLKELMASSPR